MTLNDADDSVCASSMPHVLFLPGRHASRLSTHFLSERLYLLTDICTGSVLSCEYVR